MVKNKTPRSSSKLPEWIAPQLAKLVSDLPTTTDWIHELKFDGYRIIARKEKNKIDLYTRNQNAWTDRFPEIAKHLKKLPDKDFFLDGEVVVEDDSGKSSFQGLQNAIKTAKNGVIRYYVFDIMYLNGSDLRELPLIKRKQILKKVIKPCNPCLVTMSEHIIGMGEEIFETVCAEKLEGIISKKANQPYTSERDGSWVKVKCTGREEFIIIGFTKHSKRPNMIGALLLGSRKCKSCPLEYKGKVGTGFKEEQRRELFNMLSKLKVDKPHLTVPRMNQAIWVSPKKVAEINFTEKTNDGLLRHPSFVGIRLDKSASQIIEE